MIQIATEDKLLNGYRPAPLVLLSVSHFIRCGRRRFTFPWHEFWLA
jgi:hypothetical protein